MIRKLLKVEFREAFSSMLPVGAGMLVLSALTALNSAVTARIRVSSAGFDWLGALLAFAAAVCFPQSEEPFQRENAPICRKLELRALPKD